MSYIHMNDLDQAMGQAMIASGGGGGGAVYASQARQATGYVMPGHQAPSSYSAPASTYTPTSAPPSSPTGGPPASIATGGGGGGGSGQRSRSGRIEGEDVYRSSWETSKTTVTPGYILREMLPNYVEGQTDALDMFASSSVDEGEPEEREFVDTTGGQKAIPAGPQKVFMIEDDPTLGDIGQDDPMEGGFAWKGWGCIFAAGLAGGVVGTLIGARLRRR